ncbi:uncharacterized protein (TIGR02246 family) [Microbacterium sp. AK009]|uniref:nuclear transport factor 2 family protein n=1 Tax=Microbacterium sp. AK009 TaxID=2723068 RepID=UPI0015C96639|nr:nuclear transport factor 2 family protein [Microbacterium sp. AK009]NYF18212.1 uncharacterized protein (TIGR02246 family) [Microbacterium sp. AK009]
MSDASKRLLEEANAAVDRGDYEDFLAFCTEDTVWTFVGDRTLRGKDEVRTWMLGEYEKPPRNNVAQLIAEDDSLVALGTIVTVHGGREVTHTYCDVWRLRDGKLSELRAFVM